MGKSGEPFHSPSGWIDSGSTPVFADRSELPNWRHEARTAPEGASGVTALCDA